MSKKKKRNTPARPWEPWRIAIPVDRVTGEDRSSWLKEGEQFVTNGLYNVHITPLDRTSDKTPPMIWLSISRKDRKTVKDWRHLQRIKNELVGPECEGVELYPAESRLADSANQFHLWVVTDPEFRWGFGFLDRLVQTPEETAETDPSAVQRAFHE